eukprot:scaffold2025_cov255-Pinguiococcus_pyrenoidosus.AAC.1
MIVRNGCPYEDAADQRNSDECVGDEDLKTGRVVQDASGDAGTDGSLETIYVTSSQASNGVVQSFVEASSRFLETRAGAGRFFTEEAGGRGVAGYQT